MSKLLTYFSDKPIFGLPIDDFETFDAVLNKSGINIQNEIDRYNQDSYKDIQLLFNSSPIKLNLGVESEKSRLKPTDKSNGVFDFSLALNGMYKVPEYYSKQLAEKYPNLFFEFELPEGVVPNNLVKDRLVDGQKEYYYETNGEEFLCVLQQKGTAAIDQGIPNAKKKYATSNRKVYLTFKRNRGKVKYVEIYSLFYYNTNESNSLEGDIMFAVRHLPALMLSEYLESIGVKVRFYMTRFVALNQDSLRMRDKDPKTGLKLPMKEMLPSGAYLNSLLVMPIIVKDFGQDMNKLLSLLVSSESGNKVYKSFARESLDREATNDSPALFGNPSHSKEAYLTGFARYKEKYFDYVEKGLLKTKEVLPEAMIFFHDYVIKEYLNSFTTMGASLLGITNEAQVYISDEINPLFTFWMKTSSKHLKHKIELINSNQLKKDLSSIQKELFEIKGDFEVMLNKIDKNTNKKLFDYYERFGNIILQGYKMINDKKDIDFVTYIKDIEIEITNYAQGIIYPTKEETQEKMDELFININTELENFK